MALAALARLRFPTLFLIFAGLFLLDLFVPDFVPFIDELLLGIVTLLLAMLKRRGEPDYEQACARFAQPRGRVR